MTWAKGNEKYIREVLLFQLLINVLIKYSYLLLRILQLYVDFLGYFVLFGDDNTSNLLDITEVKRLKINREVALKGYARIMINIAY